MAKPDANLARRVLELREQVEGMERDKARLEGRQEQTLQRLREEHDCSSLAEGKKLLAKLDKEARKLEKEFSEAMKAFQDKWGQKLEEQG